MIILACKGILMQEKMPGMIARAQTKNLRRKLSENRLETLRKKAEPQKQVGTKGKQFLVRREEEELQIKGEMVDPRHLRMFLHKGRAGAHKVEEEVEVHLLHKEVDQNDFNIIM
jgi:hypothetical protein